MKKIFAAAAIFTFGLFGCTDPGEMTGVGAATGGVIGAGLGAIVGSQTGSTGGGIAIGAAGGAAAGAMVGNALQAQDETMRSQDEAIERQQEMLAANQRELNVLKGTSDTRAGTNSNLTFPSRYEPPVRGGVRKDTTSARASYSPPQRTTSSYEAPPREMQAKTSDVRAAPSSSTAAIRPPPAPQLKSGEIQERDIAAPQVTEETITEKEVPVAVNEENTAEVAEDAQAATEPAKVVEQVNVSDDCKRAAGEVVKGNESREIADRLFHYRRALRLCPNNAEYHNLLGETYISLNRTVDAEFEFREALKINPELEQAKSNLAALR